MSLERRTVSAVIGSVVLLMLGPVALADWAGDLAQAAPAAVERIAPEGPILDFGREVESGVSPFERVVGQGDGGFAVGESGDPVPGEQKKDDDESDDDSEDGDSDDSDSDADEGSDEDSEDDDSDSDGDEGSDEESDDDSEDDDSDDDPD